ncbi:F0F1 ATP synthase subunit epsilon [Nocardioides sp.]|jgi:F-type H+-transporting ATPase subunit epsilon|uniref:F0F1 ATP synthase subunit epsilon n=1 Tax=Nocardioides sp. TaxID=35761 RepID=UPI002638C0CA|nr:F0F1 ATP synthase subunit epsilon [Nocardioides sp.]
MAGTITVDLVAADRVVWSGEASTVSARTVDGDLGILPGHAPLLSLLASSAVEIKATEGGVVTAEVDGGFISVAHDHVSILSEHVSL